MGEITTGMNWVAVIVGTIAAFVLGWLWYSPSLFGKAWAKGVGVELGSATGMPVAPMVAQLIATFFLAWVVGVTEVESKLMTIILILVTIALIVASGGLFTRKSTQAIAIDAGFILAMGAVMIAAQGIL